MTTPQHKGGPVSDRYLSLVAGGEFAHDAVQLELATRLDALSAELGRERLSSKKSSLGWLFGKNQQVDDAPRGFYIWGGVGRGKSMLMDMFFASAPEERKRRVHFHAFMQDVHERIHEWRQKRKERSGGGDDPVPHVAEALAGETRLLCFDEFSVTDVADAMILSRLFTGLFSRGVTVVATSNVAPDDLYATGLNRSFFLKFIDLLKERLTIFELDAGNDYRMEKLKGSDVYFAGRNAAFHDLWKDMTLGLETSPVDLKVKGRKLHIPAAAAGMARTTFDDLCGKPLGAADYLALADHFHTLFLEGIPVMAHASRNEAKRFITLVDTLYDRHIKLVASAEAPPSRLYDVNHGTEAFEFARTVSRLQEMQGKAWLETARKAAGRS